MGSTHKMVITLTSITLRSVWKYFQLTNNARKIMMQAKKSKGFVRMKNTGWGKLHYTLSVWESVDDLKQFARSGAHLAAMKVSQSLSTELATYTYETDHIPNWKEAKALLVEKGKVLHFK
jgi:heme-degrading monooxygenase HmoA